MIQTKTIEHLFHIGLKCLKMKQTWNFFSGLVAVIDMILLINSSFSTKVSVPVN